MSTWELTPLDHVPPNSMTMEYLTHMTQPPEHLTLWHDYHSLPEWQTPEKTLPSLVLSTWSVIMRCWCQNLSHHWHFSDQSLLVKPIPCLTTYMTYIFQHIQVPLSITKPTYHSAIGTISESGWLPTTWSMYDSPTFGLKRRKYLTRN